MRKRKRAQCERQLSLFDLDLLPLETPEEMIESLRHNDVFRYRTRQIKAGNMLELEIYPMWKPQADKRAREINISRAAQENLNHKNTKKKIMRLTNANFTDGDIWGTFGYDDDNMPQSSEAARRDIANFFRRVKRYCGKKRIRQPLYIYVTEWRSGEGDKPIRCHHHIIITGCLDRDTLERLWKGGAYPQTRRLRVKEDCGLNGMAAYLAKGSRYEKMWGHSLHMKMPVESVADHKITPRQAAKIAVNANAAPEIFEKACKGYIFREMEIKRSDWVAGAYIYVQMYKRRN